VYSSGFQTWNAVNLKGGLRSNNSILEPLFNLEGVIILQVKVKLCQEENGFYRLHDFNYGHWKKQ
jgi:hypothetical protein